MKTIEISDKTYDLLKSWASVSCTIGAAINELIEVDTEQAQYTVTELQKLQRPLDDCNRACKDLKAKLEFNEWQKTRK